MVERSDIHPGPHVFQQPEDLPWYRYEGREVGVLFHGLNVWGKVAGEARAKDILAIFQDVFFESPINLVRRIIGRRIHRNRLLIHDAVGTAEPGKTLLVLGRPGSGCSTLLKALANQHGSFEKVEGHLQHGAFPFEESTRLLRSNIVYSGEDDVHFPTLSVGHSMEFALNLRKPKRLDHESNADFVRRLSKTILESLGIAHTKDTIVGDAFVRGVSGGERRRVTLAEVLTAGPAIVCWDNPLRGLDSSSALSFLKLLKTLSTTTGMTNIVTAYQVSESIYQECFDRVLLLYEGRTIYSGPAGNEAKAYFTHHLGFHCPDRQTTSDFLTAITSPEERQVVEGFTPPPPMDPDGLAERFRQSAYFRELEMDMKQFRIHAAEDKGQIAAIEEDIRSTKHPLTRREGFTTRTFHSQLIAAMTRHYQLLWGMRKTVFTVIMFNIINALVISAAYFLSPDTNNGAFMRSGAIFFALIFFALNSLSEVTPMVKSRLIMKKHYELGMLHPGIGVVSLTLAELPLCFIQTLLFSIPYYFIIGLSKTASGFWYFELIMFASYAAFMALFRAMAASVPNVPVALMLAGAAFPVVLLPSGYAPIWPTLLRWSSWIRRISPSPFALEALMAFEFSQVTLHCAPDEMVPNGAAYEATCPLPGAEEGSATSTGPDYLATRFDYYASHVWRNFGIIVAMWAIYTCMMAVGQTCMTRRGEGAAVGRRYKRGAVLPSDLMDRQVERKEVDVESQSSHHPNSSDQHEASQADSPAAFTFSEVSYIVSVEGGKRKLLDNVNGYVKPGQLTALMGVSGAGKTTLLDTLAWRKIDGEVSGDIKLGGRPIIDLGNAFSQACGFCMQQDVHDEGTTVKEALVFSALMRRPLSIPKEEKLAHVEKVIDLLALRSIQDALVGKPGEGGLGVEERKRLTIGVELAADPSALLFLDEPTSGLDSQAAFSLVRFLQTIAATGVPIVCTIHQPSAIIFDMFDHILLLAPGGRTVYFGETGKMSSTVVDYFSRHGAPMAPNANPAEFILDTVAERTRADTWTQHWRESAENKKLKDDIETINRSSPHTAVMSHNLPILHQCIYLTKRHAISIWRDGFYSFSRLSKAIFMALFVSFNFFKPHNSQQDAQNRILALLILQWIVPSSAADLFDIWFSKWTLFTTRERAGVGYSPFSLCAALIIVEVPIAIIIYTFFFLCSWWTVGFGFAGFGYLNFLALGIFGIGFPFAIASLCANSELAGYASSLIWCVMATFGGIAVPHADMNNFYRPWLFWADPMRYFLGATASVGLHDVPIKCSKTEIATLQPLDGMTCGTYLREYLATNTGYVVNPDSRRDCGFCPYSTGDEYLAGFDFYFDDRWRDWGVFTAFCFSTLAIAFICSWLRYGRGINVSKIFYRLRQVKR
ncbi:ABC transporter-like protein [Aaosphaeria arxii CBS 175.79]|uniref:ABC transporter-like protein n=1 Tax=Aaosphaeria arxii CBS 175.79 TaxID=1450172 RepID=A0A6A5Y803_9PLEO|nr:ABC transporter-like protein [Aaosphaeria arxii CBS 175.79]KAF2021147.1 ABC transporter-like protein [Aaosphaeria arxii CBS 175.79]